MKEERKPCPNCAEAVLPRLWVRPAFYALEFSQKQTLVAVIYAYYFDGSRPSDSVRIYNSMTGKEIGGFNPNLGGLKLD